MSQFTCILSVIAYIVMSLAPLLCSGSHMHSPLCVCSMFLLPFSCNCQQIMAVVVHTFHHRHYLMEGMITPGAEPDLNHSPIPAYTQCKYIITICMAYHVLGKCSASYF
eukprot:scpid92163/ scgid21606/ 